MPRPSLAYSYLGKEFGTNTLDVRAPAGHKNLLAYCGAFSCSLAYPILVGEGLDYVDDDKDDDIQNTT